MRAFFRALANALTAPWVLALALTLFFVLLAWFLGPYVAIAEHKILESVVSRLMATLVLVFLWGLFIAVFYSRRKKKELADPEKAAAAEQTEQERAALREEKDYIRDKIKNAIRIVTCSNFYSDSNRSRYNLPWFLVIGPENCGKTSFLLNSGLQFPLNEQADRHLYQLKATTRCETMFANQAVFIDTPGSYTDSRRESRQGGLWQLLLKRIFHVRPAKPANGVIVCVSIRDIMDADAPRREHLARTIRERLSEVLQTLRTHVPVFLVFTKCDAAPGFAQFFAQLPRAEREQMFGCPAGKGFSMDMGKLRGETAEMLRTLNAQIISKIHQERDIAARGDIFRFPQELAALGPNIEDFITEAFGASRYHRPVMFRGFFFTSALSSQDVLKSAARGGELAFQTGFQPSQGDYAKGFFILRLLQDCVIPEASLAGADRENLWALRLRRHGLQLAATAFFIFAASFLGISFINNYLNIESISDLHSSFSEQRASLPDPQDARAVLPELDIIEKTLHIYNPSEDSGISYGLGLYQGDAMGDAARAAYLGELNDRLLPQARQTAAQKIEQSLKNVGELKPALRAYLMLCEPKHLKRDFVSDWLGRQWSSLFMGDAPAQAALARHMDYAMLHGIRPVEPDQALLNRARQALLKIPLAELAYQQMKEEAQEGGKPPFTFRSSLGESMSPFDGDTYRIPYLYTRKGYEEYCVERCPAIIRSMTDDSWIFGSNPLTLSSLDMDRIYKDVRAMYFRDYTRFWTEAVRKLNVPAPRTLSAAANTAERLTAGVSPVALVLREVRDNTNLILAEDKTDPVAGAVADQAQKQAARKIGSALGAQVGKAVTQSAADKLTAAKARARAAAQKDALAIRQYFLPLLSLIDPDGNPAPALKAAHDAMANTSTYLTKLHSSDDPAQRVFTALLEIADNRDETLRELENAARKLPSPVRGWYESVPSGSLRRMLFLAADYINQAYLQRVVHVYTRDLSPYYPFNSQTNHDVSLDSFSSFFRSGGTLDSFYDAYLRPFINSNGTLRSIMGQTLPLSSQDLAQLTRANRVQSAFFSSGRELGINFTMEPYALDASRKQVTFSIDNEAVSYWHGMVQGRNFSWPGNHSRASLEMTDLNGISQRNDTRGDWAMFRILQAGTIKKQENNTCLVEIRQNGGWAQFLIQFRNKLNPFDPAVCSFTLPTTLQ